MHFNNRAKLALALFLAPPLLYIIVWRVLPLLYTVYLSLLSWNLVSQRPARFVGLSNYAALLKDTDFHHSLQITLVFTVAATLLELGYGLVLALLMDRNFRGRSAAQAILLVPMVITPVVVGTIWYILFHNSIGPINYVLGLVGLPGLNWLSSTSTALASIIIADVWQWSPFMFLLLLAGLQVIPKEIYEAADVDGASGWQKFRLITLPFLKGTILVAVILRSMDAIRVFDKIFVLTGGGPSNSTEVASILIYKVAFKFFDMGYAAAMVVVLLAIISTLYIAYVRSTRL